MYVLFFLAYLSIGYIEYVLFNITAAGAVDREFVYIVAGGRAEDGRASLNRP